MGFDGRCAGHGVGRAAGLIGAEADFDLDGGGHANTVEQEDTRGCERRRSRRSRTPSACAPLVMAAPGTPARKN